MKEARLIDALRPHDADRRFAASQLIIETRRYFPSLPQF
jgi:hypothetical protein